jgi:hypothetical protein
MTDNRLAQLDWLVEAAQSRSVHELAQAVPERATGPGRKRHYPALVGILYVLNAGGITGSHRSAVVLMNSERVWRLVREAVREAHGITLRHKPPKRHHLEGWRTHLAEHVELLRETARNIAVRQAIEAGCFDPRSAHTDLRRSDALYADGKVVRSPFLSETVKRWLQQDKRLDVGRHVQSGEDSPVAVTGSKFLFVGARPSDAPNTRVVLDVAYLPPDKGYGGEAGAAVGMITKIQQLVAAQNRAAQTLCYDGALRGMHIDPLMKSGLTVLSPVHPSAAALLPLEIVKGCECGREHKLSTKEGAVCETLVLDTGEKHVQPLPVRQLVKRRNQSIVKAHRWYQTVELSCGNTRLIRVDNTDEDRKTGYNRADRIRQHAPGTQVYKDCYGWRDDAESTNNTLGHTLYGNRCIAHTADKQLLSMIGFQLARNVLAAHALNREQLRSTA